jgi:hypothetical protein
MRYVSYLLVALTIAAAACAPEPAPSDGLDSRTLLTLPVDAAEAVRTEMRTMLSSLHDIHLGLATSDTARVHRAAVASGLAAAADPALEPLLPAEFLSLGVATHTGFDSLALAVAGGAPRDSLLARLPGITANCVSCHATYRLAASAPR